MRMPDDNAPLEQDAVRGAQRVEDDEAQDRENRESIVNQDGSAGRDYAPDDSDRDSADPWLGGG
jgi:hypothetical protein